MGKIIFSKLCFGLDTLDRVDAKYLSEGCLLFSMQIKL